MNISEEKIKELADSLAGMLSSASKGGAVSKEKYLLSAEKFIRGFLEGDKVKGYHGVDITSYIEAEIHKSEELLLDSNVCDSVCIDQILKNQIIIMKFLLQEKKA